MTLSNRKSLNRTLIVQLHQIPFSPQKERAGGREEDRDTKIRLTLFNKTLYDLTLEAFTLLKAFLSSIFKSM